MPSLNPFQYVKTPALDTSGQIDQASLMQKQQLINALQQMSVNPEQTQSTNGIVARQSLLGPLAKVLGGMLAKKQQGALNQQITAFGQQQKDKSSAALASLLGGQSTSADQTQGGIQQPMGGFQQSLSKADAALQAGVPKEIVDAYLSQAKEQNKPTKFEFGVDGTIRDPNKGVIMDANQKPLTDEAFLQRRDDARAPAKTLTSIGNGLFLDSTDNKVKDADGKALNAQQVKNANVDLTGARAAAVAANKPNSTFGSDEGDLLASLAARGASLPAGLRSKDQQISTLRGLIRKYPDLTPDQIADQIASGQIAFGAERKETQTAAAVGGKVSVAENEINTSAPLVLASSANMPRGSFIPINKLIQMGDEQISDPKLLDLKIKINSMLNAYDLLAGRGGTDVGKRDAAHKLLTSATSAEALATGIDAFKQEAQAAGAAAHEAEQPWSKRKSNDKQASGAKFLGFE